MYFIEAERGAARVMCVIASKPPEIQGYKVVRERPLDACGTIFQGRLSNKMKTALKKAAQIGFGAGTSYGKNNFK
jgi:hypothetical protein